MLTISRTTSPRIHLNQAGEAIRRHRAAAAAQPRPFHGGAVAKGQLLELLDQPACEWLRVYQARDAYDWSTLVLVGADQAAADLQQLMLEYVYPCPPFCNVDSPLFPVDEARRSGRQGISLAGRSRNHRIGVAEATALIERHREAVRGQAGSVHSGIVPSDAVRELLEQADCEWLRIYLARTTDGTQSFVLVGAEADGADLAGGIILEATGVTC